VRFIAERRTAIRDPRQPAEYEWFCFTCSFRPWTDAGDAESVAFTIRHPDGSTEEVAGVRDGDRWVTERPLAPSESASVAAGGVRDGFGNVNGGASESVTAA
jgi:hypothetical protein